jgi:hypothetical protein
MGKEPLQIASLRSHKINNYPSLTAGCAWRQGSGHVIQEDRPETVVAAIEAVLSATGSDLEDCSGPSAAGGEPSGRSP